MEKQLTRLLAALDVDLTVGCSAGPVIVRIINQCLHHTLTVDWHVIVEDPENVEFTFNFVDLFGIVATPGTFDD
jgi:hypothetical protein